MIDKLTMPFDQYQRYEICRRLIEDFHEKKQRKLKILDVGGHFKTKEGVDWLPAVEFFGENEVLVVDTTQASLDNYQVSDGRDLPFKDNSFDVVVSNDVLEHVPPQGRYDFIKELTRVSKELVIINFPYYTAKKALAEKILYEYIVNSSGGENRMLEEHLINGLPKVQDVASQLNELSMPHSYYYSGDTDNWLKLMVVNYELSRIAEPSLQELIDEYVNKYHFLGEMNLPEGYRVTFVIDKMNEMVKNNFFESVKKDTKTNLLLPTEALITYLNMKKENESKSILDTYYYDADEVLERMAFQSTIRQTFLCQSPNLFCLSFLVATYKEKLQGHLKVSLFDNINNTCVSETVFAYNTLKDNDWFNIEFTPLMDSQGKEYTIEITQVSNNIGPSFYYSEKNSYGKTLLNTKDIIGNLTLKTYCRKMNAAEQYFLIKQKNNDFLNENKRLVETNIINIEKLNKLENDIFTLKETLETKKQEIQKLNFQINESQKDLELATDRYGESIRKYNDLIKILKEI
ncbi:methyltransferase domain-containing protein [Paenibacillus wynnii]|uniref:methyltransferase domain-containing protein n=1 Tax=Paenibacillus wynnii TaxID=268407 RepID=UPI00278F18ED|nr:methyltransferase domain-containing protein [Paenibacillus wynnii]MDQ0192097.1 SAM-dependent methyltransferase [Paenibacillus wynnii]